MFMVSTSSSTCLVLVRADHILLHCVYPKMDFSYIHLASPRTSVASLISLFEGATAWRAVNSDDLLRRNSTPFTGLACVALAGLYRWHTACCSLLNFQGYKQERPRFANDRQAQDVVSPPWRAQTGNSPGGPGGDKKNIRKSTNIKHLRTFCSTKGVNQSIPSRGSFDISPGLQ